MLTSRLCAIAALLFATSSAFILLSLRDAWAGFDAEPEDFFGVLFFAALALALAAVYGTLGVALKSPGKLGLRRARATRILGLFLFLGLTLMGTIALLQGYPLIFVALLPLGAVSLAAIVLARPAETTD